MDDNNKQPEDWQRLRDLQQINGSRPSHEDESDNNFGTQAISLSLFIILLAFFIVLNASSSYDNIKTRPVIESLEKTFSTKIVGDSRLPARVESDEKGGGMGEAFDQIENIFKSEAVPFQAKRDSGNGLLFVRLTEADWEYLIGLTSDRKTNAARSQKNDFLSKMSIMLMPQNTDLRFETRIMIGLGMDPARIATEQSKDMGGYIEKADRYANAFIAQGFPSDILSVGLHTGKKFYVDIYFKRQMTAAKDQNNEQRNIEE